MGSRDNEWITDIQKIIGKDNYKRYVKDESYRKHLCDTNPGVRRVVNEK